MSREFIHCVCGRVGEISRDVKGRGGGLSGGMEWVCAPG